MIKIVKYNEAEGEAAVSGMLSRFRLDIPEVQDAVNTIIKNIRDNGDKALFSYIKEFDGAEIDTGSIRVSTEEIEEAFSNVSSGLISVMKTAIDRITAYHMKQKRTGYMEYGENGELLGTIIRPIETAGVYVPGKKASYPSSVLMNVIPAQIAGVKRIVMVTPPSSGGKVIPETLAAAKLLGITEIYKAGGAHAIAALAFGTESIPRADKITGPGNIYVALAKKSVYGFAGIDSVAGPSEILIIADKTANPRFVAADLLSQAEHDELAAAVCITDCPELAGQIAKEVERQAGTLSRRSIIAQSLKNYGAIIITPDLNKAAELSNLIAPEHLELCVGEPFSYLPKITNAGSIFIGGYTPEPLGDYLAGTNHVLPTGGTARFFSPLSVDDFIKKSSVLYFDKSAMLSLADDVSAFAAAEGLTAHANTVAVRLEE